METRDEDKGPMDHFIMQYFPKRLFQDVSQKTGHIEGSVTSIRPIPDHPGTPLSISGDRIQDICEHRYKSERDPGSPYRRITKQKTNQKFMERSE